MYAPPRNPEQLVSRPRTLRDQEYFAGVWIFDFRSRRKAFYVDVFARRKWAFDEILFPRNWNAIGKITFGNFRRRSGRGRRPHWRFLLSISIRLNRAVGVKRLLLRRVLLLGRLLRILRNVMLNPGRRFIDVARRQKKQAQQCSRKRKFHNTRQTKVAGFLFLANR